MKKIEAFLREESLQDVKDALRAIGIVGMNVHQVHGHGRQGGITLAWRGSSYQMDLLPKMQLNIFLSEHNVERTIQTIIQAARTDSEGEEGDGVIFVLPADDVIRISTGERGRDALQYRGDIDDPSGRKKEG
ncbi:MAG: P-II family nitrogen regulator [Myxococcales bacterium]|nr:P-II family nitrogen regulator [Myxococcales bacterium]